MPMKLRAPPKKISITYLSSLCDADYRFEEWFECALSDLHDVIEFVDARDRRDDLYCHSPLLIGQDCDREPCVGLLVSHVCTAPCKRTTTSPTSSPFVMCLLLQGLTWERQVRRLENWFFPVKPLDCIDSIRQPKRQVPYYSAGRQ